MRLSVLGFCLAAAMLAVAACSGGNTGGSDSAPTGALYDPQALPSGPVGESIAYGNKIVTSTQIVMKDNVRARMACAACHLAGGTQARGGSFVGTYGRFPQWNKRAQRVIALQDRIAECFLYSMNGRPPGYASKAMVAVVAYVAWISRGVPVGAPQKASDSFMEPLPGASPDLTHGAAIYTKSCASCHGADGAGAGNVFPPVWGTASFNSGAGMAHIDRMTGFVHYNMPQNAPGSLSLQDAYDVSGYVLSHKRPAFQGNVLVTSSPEPAKFF